MTNVSVIIPAYNSPHLSEAIDSVLAQSRPASEIIVVDGSPDTTPERIKVYGNRISYIYQPPRGVSAARNAGIRAAKSDLIALLDADDFWLPGKLAKQISLLELHADAAFSFSTVWNLVEEQASIPTEPFYPKPLRAWMKEHKQCEGGISGRAYELLLEANCVATSSLIIRRAAFEEIGFFDESLNNAEDYEFELRLAKRYPTIFVCEPTSRYRVHDTGLSGAWSARSELFYRTNLDALEKHYHLFPSISVKKAMARTCAGYALHCLRNGNSQLAARYSRRSLALYPSARALKYLVEAVSPRTYGVLSGLSGKRKRVADQS